MLDFSTLVYRFLAVVITTFFATFAVAKDALQILPTRVVMSSETSADLTLINKGDEAGSYRILLRNIRADDNGQFHEVTEAGEGDLFADKFIRYSPRRITIDAESNQKVRLVIRKPRNLPEGEYRTHMVFQSLPKEVPNTLDGNQEVKVSVEPIIELSIPIIVRHGQLDATIELGDLAITEEKNLSLQIQRQGTRSVYGDVEVFVNSGNAKGQQAGFVKGVSVYVPNPVRNFLLPLTFPEGFKQDSDELLVRFKEDPSYGGQQVTELTLPPS